MCFGKFWNKKRLAVADKPSKSCMYLDLSHAHNLPKLPVAGEDDDANGCG
jgi:hypothetical protein